MPTFPPFVYPGLAGTVQRPAPRPGGTLIVGDVPKPTARPKPPTVGTTAPKPPAAFPAAPPASPSSPTAPSPKPYDPSVYSVETDPVVAEIKAAGAQSVDRAQAAALEGRRNLLAGFGSQELARQILGVNDPTIGAISDNPDTSLSTLGQINRSYREQGRQTDEQLNQPGVNLFYSGERVRRLSDLGHNQQAAVSNATQALRERLAGIDQSVLDTQEQARQREIQARNDALNRAVQFAIQYGVDPGANPGGSDNPDTGLSALQSAGLDFTGLTPPAAAADLAIMPRTRPLPAPLPNAYLRRTVANLR